MSQLTDRSISVLKIIVEEYIKTWEVLWSKMLLKKYDLWVSPATIRNDMAFLESLDLVYQPYNSAWRLPTTKWLRVFVNYLMKDMPEYFLNEPCLNLKNNDIKTTEDFIYNITREVALKTKEIGFFIIKEDWILEYNGFSNFLERNFKNIKENIFWLLKMFEDKNNFIKFISSLPIYPWVNVFIWEENLLSFLKDYTLIVKKVFLNWKESYIWIIWTLKMDYNFNINFIKGII